ncbi:MAG TPA: LamG-like jellyroll fold domain-containing protein [Pirellulaceae bacterium]
MSDIDHLVQRYVEDRSALSVRELDELIAALKADAGFAVSVREQLLLDDLLAQKFTIDRRNFVAQVEQRIADLGRGQNELCKQTADLRSLAAAEKNSPRWVRYVLALSILIAMGGVAAVMRFWPHGPVIATVTAVTGDGVRIEQDGGSEAAEVDDSLESGQRIVVARNSSVTLSYDDGSELRIDGSSEGKSVVVFDPQEHGGPKQIHIERGELVANIKPQLAGSMKFVTPHGVATAPVSHFRLVVTNDETLVEVKEGKVQLNRTGDNRPLLVAANETGMASRETQQIRTLTWPYRRDGLAYLFSPLESAPKENKPLTVVRDAETRSFRTTLLEPRGEAALMESRWFYELNGGYLVANDAGSDIFNAGRGGSELTVEAVFSPASMDQAGPARIVALADEGDEPDFALEQEGQDFMFCIKTDAESPPSPPRMTINSSDTPLHLTMTYRYGELIAYRDGMEIARSKDMRGSLGAWRSGPLTVGADAAGERPWRGVMEAVALYNRCLEPGEVARNARNYKLLARGGM